MKSLLSWSFRTAGGGLPATNGMDAFNPCFPELLRHDAQQPDEPVGRSGHAPCVRKARARYARGLSGTFGGLVKARISVLHFSSVRCSALCPAPLLFRRAFIRVTA